MNWRNQRLVVASAAGVILVLVGAGAVLSAVLFWSMPEGIVTALVGVITLTLGLEYCWRARDIAMGRSSPHQPGPATIAVHSFVIFGAGVTFGLAGEHVLGWIFMALAFLVAIAGRMSRSGGQRIQTAISRNRVCAFLRFNLPIGLVVSVLMIAEGLSFGWMILALNGWAMWSLSQSRVTERSSEPK